MKKPNLFFGFHTFRHPHPDFQALWNWFQFNLLIFPLWPAVGGVGLVLTVVATYKQHLKTIIHRPLNWGFAILGLWLVITACLAWDRPAALLGLANLVPYFGIFAGFCALIHTPDQLKQIAWILVLPSVPVTMLGFGQLFWGWSGSPFFQGILGWTIQANGNPPGRMASVFMYANILAAYLCIVFIFSLGLWIEELAQGKVKWKRQDARFLGLRIGFLSVAVIGNAIALILTNSRNAWAICALSCLAFALYYGWYWLVAGISTIVGIILGAAFSPPPINNWLRKIVPAFFWARLNDQLYPNRPIAELRTTQWQFAWSMTQQRPLTGWGLRNFTPLYEAQMHLWLGHPHNFFLMLTAETGIPATIIFCGLITWIMLQGVLLLTNPPSAWQQSNQSEINNSQIIFTFLIAFIACTLFNTVDVTLFDFRVNGLVWVLISAICGVVYQRQAIASLSNA